MSERALAVGRWPILRSVIGLPVLTLLTSACVHSQGSEQVVVVAQMGGSVFNPADTLRVRRVVYNRGRREVWLTWGSVDLPEVRDSAGRAACRFTGARNLQLMSMVLPGGDSLVRPVNFPLSQLDDCGPGRYTAVAVQNYQRDRQASVSSRALAAPVTFRIGAR